MNEHPELAILVIALGAIWVAKGGGGRLAQWLGWHSAFATYVVSFAILGAAVVISIAVFVLIIS